MGVKLMPGIDFEDDPGGGYYDEPEPFTPPPPPPDSEPPPSGNSPYQSSVNYWALDNPQWSHYGTGTPENVNRAFTSFLGRPFDQTGVNPWANQTDFYKNIYNSEEAFNYRTRPRAPKPESGSGGGGNPQALWQQWSQANRARQSEPNSLVPFIEHLKANGINASLDQRNDGLHKGIMLNGQFIKLLDGYDNPIWLPGGDQPGGGPDVSSYMAQFSDPSTKLLEQYLTRQMATLSGQQAQQQQANATLKARMPDVQAATDRLIAYLNSRATQLQGAPYTGTEQEILRTQALEPIERDRTAANKRALEQIGARGLTPESGIALDLQNQVNSIFDRQRAGAQGELAYKTINEQRSRQQEAQQLLGLVPSVQRAAATGDLSFLEALDAAVNQPVQQAIGLAQTNQQLPSLALNDALRALGAGPDADKIYQQSLGLYNTQTQQSQQSQYALGQMLAYLLGDAF